MLIVETSLLLAFSLILFLILGFLYHLVNLCEIKNLENPL